MDSYGTTDIKTRETYVESGFDKALENVNDFLRIQLYKDDEKLDLLLTNLKKAWESHTLSRIPVGYVESITILVVTIGIAEYNATGKIWDRPELELKLSEFWRIIEEWFKPKPIKPQ